MGAVLGAVLHLAIKMPGLVRYGFRWWPVVDLSSPAVRRVAAADGASGGSTWASFTSRFWRRRTWPHDWGRESERFGWGWQLMQLPETVIGTAFGLVALPHPGRTGQSHGDWAALRTTLGQALRAVMALTVPAACGLILLGRPLLQLLYQRGAFDAAATDAVLVALRFYALGLMGHACLELAARAFFAQQDTVTPLYLAIASAAASIGLGILLMQPLDYAGLALATSAITGEVIALLLTLVGAGAAWKDARCWRRCLALAASLIMGGAMILATQSAERGGARLALHRRSRGDCRHRGRSSRRPEGLESAKSTVSYPRCSGLPAPFDHHGPRRYTSVLSKTRMGKTCVLVGCHSERLCPETPVTA